MAGSSLDAHEDGPPRAETEQRPAAERHALGTSIGVIPAERSRAFVRRVGGVLRRRAGVVQRRIDATARQRRLRATAGDEKELVARLIGALPGTAVDHGPLVSIIILNRNGRHHLERCLDALARTAYRDLEIIVVDNGSTDGSAEFAERIDLPFPVKVIRNKTNRSFSEANGQGAAIADGELLCFYNNDVDPIDDDWLGYMVETMTSRDAVAVGVRLIYPRHRGMARAGRHLPDLSLQHAGVGFDRRLAVPHAEALGAGEDPLEPWAAEVGERPALTAACMLVRLDAFRTVGGFSPDYDYGIEDVDLCLKLREAGGRLMYDGRAALWHHESATRAADRTRFEARVKSNREAFIDLWGPRIYRDALLDALRGGDRFSPTRCHVAFVQPTGRSEEERTSPTIRDELGSALERFGWRVTDLIRTDGKTVRDPSVDAVVVIDDSWDFRRAPRKMVTIAYIQDDPDRWVNQPWFDDYDVVLAADDRIAAFVRDRSAKVARSPVATPDGRSRPLAETLRDALIEWVSATRFGISVEASDAQTSDRGEPASVARVLQRELERAGHPTRVHLPPEWRSPTAARDDVALHVTGSADAPTHRSQVDILWHVSDAHRATRAIYDRYDHVFVAPALFDPEVAARASVSVQPLDPQAAPERNAEVIRHVAERLGRGRPAGIERSGTNGRAGWSRRSFSPSVNPR